MTLTFQEIFMRFYLEGKEFELKSIEGKHCKLISSNNMAKLLKNGQHGVIAQLCSLNVQTSKEYVPLDLQIVIETHSNVFADIPKGLLVV